MKEGHELVGHEKFKECLEYFKEVAAEVKPLFLLYIE